MIGAPPDIITAILTPQIIMVIIMFLIWVALFPVAIAQMLLFKNRGERLGSCVLYLFLVLPVITWLLVK
jgi:hypothetical protein